MLDYKESLEASKKAVCDLAACTLISIDAGYEGLECCCSKISGVVGVPLALLDFCSIRFFTKPK